MGFTGFYWVLLGFTGFYWVLLGFIQPSDAGRNETYTVLPSFQTSFYRVSVALTGFWQSWKEGLGLPKP